MIISNQIGHWMAALMLLSTLAIASASLPPERIPLWPDNSSTSVGPTTSETSCLTIYRPEYPNGTIMIICPGGGYGKLCVGPEGTGIATWLNQHGIIGAVLEYRLPHGDSKLPLLDAQRAIRLVRSKAAAWQGDPHRIGIIGFSAGGHLASTAGTHFDEGNPRATDPIERCSSRPDFMALIYPVITMGPLAHAGSKRNLLGSSPTEQEVDYYSSEKQVTEKTPPVFLAHAMDDKVVPPENSRLFDDALKMHGIPAEYLKLPSGGHGLNGYKGPSWDAWQKQFLQWLLAQKSLTPITRSVTPSGVITANGANAPSVEPVAKPRDALVERFLNPPEDTRPGCYWYWLDSYISKEGITKDIEAMSRVGIGRAYIGILGGSPGPKPKEVFTPLSEPWWDNIRHAIREGGRLGVEIGVFNSPGWSQSGGPWVKPEQAMRYVVSSEISIQGPQAFSGQLPKPKGLIQEIAVLAYPKPLFDGMAVSEKERTATSATFASAQPVKVRSITIIPVKSVDVSADLEVSDDGVSYRKLAKFPVNRGNLSVNVGAMPLAPVVVSLPPTAGSYFRITFSKACEVGEIRISSAARTGSVYEKQLAKMYPGYHPTFDAYVWPEQAEPDAAGLTVAGDQVRVLSSRLKADGTFDWQVPPGEWIIQRLGMAMTGTKNDPAPPRATGWEVDKINREPLKAHFDAYIGKILESMPSPERKAFKYVIADSYERGGQNWTDGFNTIFYKRYGYDPLPWLPVVTGRLVESADKSDRFLWDLRRLVADRVATEYVGGLRDLSHEHGLTVWLENYGHWGFPAEFLQYGGQSDEVAGEFSPDLNSGKIEVRAAASAAHIYGKKRVWCESFTGYPDLLNTPRDLKANGDWSFSEGVTQAILHVYVHQPEESRGPGFAGWFGTEFNRKNTWWNLGMKPWIDYQRKCTVMLQAGNPVADVAYYIGEDAPKMTGTQKPALPPGYDYDYINAEVIINRLSVKDGRLVLPEGTDYRVLVLPPVKTMRPAVLRKLKQLVQAGATVVGPAPEKSPSMENFPQSDAEVKTLVGELWGRGKIRAIDNLETVLTTGPDVILPEGLVWKHRREGNRDIYFIANRSRQANVGTLSFRVKGKQPELWWPESGKIEAAPAFKLAGDRIEVPLKLEALTSVFVVFDKPVTKDRSAAQPAKSVTEQAIIGPWEVQFNTKQVTFDKLIPWTESSDPEIKYYSGEAVYRTHFNLSAVQGEVTLDLGTVNAIAQVRLNGTDLGVLWKPPYRVVMADGLKAGQNDLEVTVVQTWRNRVIGDLQPGATPTVFQNRIFQKPTDSLLPSGLLGPVTIRATDIIK